MKFEQSRHFDTLKTVKRTLPIGDFYFCEKFYLAEIHEGVHLNYEELVCLMEELISFYGKNKKLGFISNRINSYSVDPRLYNEIDNKYNIIEACALVVYSDISFMNASIERRFSKKKIKRCILLDEAIEWILERKELV